MSETMTGIKRTHYVGTVTEQEKDTKVCVTGWVKRRRDLGGVIFIDLRDRSGILQVVFDAHDVNSEDFEKAERLRSEYVIAVEGMIEQRDEETYNPSLPTGTIELRASSLRILSEAKTPPFMIEDNSIVREEVRLKHRYLDLRRSNLFKNLQFRHDALKIIRGYFDGKQFLDVDTPMLNKSTPEGARDYLVPSRVHPGEFYALPQSPQIFKQLLMVSGVDKYYQVAKCFRDEDLRADRQPEFTQVDLEMSFVDEEEIISNLEKLFKKLFKDMLDVEVAIPFNRLTYQEAMDRFGSDKPDMRFEMELVDISHIAKECSFQVFSNIVKKGGSVRAINAKGCGSFSRSQIDVLGDKALTYGAKGMAWITIDEFGEAKSVITKFFKQEEIDEMVKVLDGQAGDLLLFCADKLDVVYNTLGNLRLDVANILGFRKKDDYKFVVVTEFPLLEWSKEQKRCVAMHHPFTMPLEEDLELMDSEPLKVRARSYDIVLNGVELGSGSVRIHQKEVQQKVFETIGFSEEETKDRFGFMLEAFEYGTPPHAGFAFGLDRLIMLMVGSDTIKDVIAFPKMRDASCLMTQAPSTVAKEQLEELQIKLDIL